MRRHRGSGGSVAATPKDKRHPIQVVARRTGLSADVLRAWEKRYGILRPSRSAGGRRLYSDDDIEYLRLLRRATRAGRSVGQLAGLSRGDLEGLVREDDVAATAVVAEAGVATPAVAVERALAAVVALDGVGLGSLLRSAMVENEVAHFLDGVVVPLLARIGQEWHDGRLTPAHEHLASRAVRIVLNEFMAMFAPIADAPRLLMATLQGQRHEFGAMLAAAAATAAGWRVTYLGVDLPAGAIAAAAHQAGATVVGLSFLHPTDDPAIRGELAALRAALPADTVVVAGGRAAPNYGRALKEIRAVVFVDLRGWRAALTSLAGSRARA
jgi:methylmalonyl-CoA mutase cobalamin-binding subunit